MFAYLAYEKYWLIKELSLIYFEVEIINIYLIFEAFLILNIYKEY